MKEKVDIKPKRRGRPPKQSVVVQIETAIEPESQTSDVNSGLIEKFSSQQEAVVEIHASLNDNINVNESNLEINPTLILPTRSTNNEGAVVQGQANLTLNASRL